MKKINLFEFKKLCENINPTSFIFMSGTLKEFSVEKPLARLRTKSVYDKIHISFPDTISFINGENYMELSGVKSINVDDNSKFIDIICGDVSNSLRDIVVPIMIN